MEKRKKIILYNTHLTGLINYGNLQIEKMRRVFAFFKEHEELILWWRPHPLSKSTLKSMNPQLLEEYMQLEQDYKEEDIGIFDDTPDVDRAILYADGYYGDDSSLVALCRAAGKPILIQNVTVSEKIEPLRLRYCKAVEIESKVYMYSSEINAIFSIDIEKGIHKIERRLLEEETLGEAYELAAGMKGQLFLLPYKTGNMLVYDVEKGIIKKILIDMPKGLRYHNSVVLSGNRVFFLPYTGTRILKYDLNEEKIFYIDNWNASIRQAGQAKKDALCFMHADAKKENFFYAALASSGQILQYQIDSGSACILPFGKAAYGCSDLLWDGQKFWAVTKRGELFIWKENGHIEEIKILVEGLQIYGEFPFMKLIPCNDWIYIFPRYANMVFRIHRSTFEAQRVYQIEKSGETFKFGIAGPICYCADLISQDRILALFPIENSLVIINGRNASIKKLSLRVGKTDAEKIKEYIIGQNLFKESTISSSQDAKGVFQEGWPKTLEAFAEHLNFVKRTPAVQKVNIGEQIYKYMKEELRRNA